MLIQALEKLKGEGVTYELHVVGGFRERQYEVEINRIIENSSVKGQIKFHGWKTQEEILSIYKECSIFVLPSQQETLPVSIAEAMAMGKVVIASNVGAISEMFRNNISGLLFQKNNLEDLCNCLRRLNNNCELIDSMSLEATLEARSKYETHMVASRTIDFYKSVLHRRQRVPNLV